MGKAKWKEYRWRKIQYHTPSVDLIACVEESTEDMCDWTPYMYFKQSEVGVTGEVVLKMTTLSAGKKSQGFCKQLLYISSPGAKPKRERNPLHWHDPD